VGAEAWVLKIPFIILGIRESQQLTEEKSSPIFAPVRAAHDTNFWWPELGPELLFRDIQEQ
jgi:hypothetical protein